MTFFPIPPASFLYGVLLSTVTYPPVYYLISPLLLSKFGSASLQQKISQYDSAKFYSFHSMLPSVVHALAQIIGVFTVVIYGREGLDDNTEMSGERPSVVKFDERTFVPYGLTPLGPTIYMGIFVGYLLSDMYASPSLKALGYIFAFHHLAASAAWTYCASHRIMQPLAVFLQFNELSTPLLHLRQMLMFAGCDGKNDIGLTIVNISFFLLFGMIRVAPLPWIVYHWISTDYTAIKTEVGIGGAIVLSFFVAAHVGLQVSWFTIMCRKLVNMVRRTLNSKQHSKKS